MPTTLQSFQELFHAYEATEGVFDELLQSPRLLRSPYAEFVSELEGVGRFEFSRRWTQAKRTVRDNGIAYSGYSGKAARPRTWTLDAIPVLLSSGDWDHVKRAVAQRAQLLNIVLKDLYGPQHLIRDRVLPAALIYSDPGFFRSYRELSVPGERRLHVYATDIARTPDGGWCVLADRTEAPSGLGYVLEHRIVMSRMLPEVFRKSQVRRLAPFFTRLQDSLYELAHHNRDNPRIVLLSDGPVNPYHLEDAYLARYLGFMLVEDGDLAIRSNRVMLKTLGGLQTVDVVLRHQNSNHSDPLVHNTLAGVAGLTQAVRANEVAIGNSLGSGLLESTAYMAFAERLCKVLLDEELLLPNVATWWCGETDGLEHVIANLDEVVVQPAYRHRGQDQPLRRQLQSMNRKELIAAIRAQPSVFAAQQRVDCSRIPVWGRRLNSERMAIRCYAVEDGQAYAVMDGGLGRVTQSDDSLELTIREGETSKDVWVVSDEPVELNTLLSDHRSKAEVRRSDADLPSRVADNLFWLGRRLERAEDHARLVNVTATRLAGEVASDHPEMPMLLRCLSGEGLVNAAYAEESQQSLPPITIPLPESVFDIDQTRSLLSCINHLVRLGSLVRDRLSVQAWRVIQQIDEGFGGHRREQVSVVDLIEITNELLIQLAALSGIFMESMTRTQVFQFLDLGRRIERSQQILSILENGILSTNNPPRALLETTLELADSLMTYRSRYLANVHTVGVMDLVVTDETNPRSLAYQLARAKQHIDQLPREESVPEFSPEQRSIMTLLTGVRQFDVETAMGQADPPDISGWNDQVVSLSNLLSHRYLVHAALPQHLTDIGAT